MICLGNQGGSNMTKKHLYLHIGTNKTGSSSIQHWLKENRSLLEADSYYYPMEGAYFYSPEESSSFLAHSVLERRPKYIGNTVINRDACVSDIRRDIQKSSCKRIIVSSEHFSYALKVEEVKKIFDVFYDLFETMTVIVYLRRQDHRLESSWSQNVKVGDISLSFDEFLNEHLSAPKWNYFELMAPWVEIFGKDNVIIKPFEKGQFVKDELIQDFLDTIGFNAEVVNAGIKNESPAVEFVEILRLLGSSIPIRVERSAFFRILKSLPIKFDRTKYTLFTPEKRKALLDLYKESNQLVAEKYLGRSDGMLFYDIETSKLPTYPGMSLERFSIISREIIQLLIKVNSQLVKKIRKLP
jgi:hypothetical protein